MATPGSTPPPGRSPIAAVIQSIGDAIRAATAPVADFLKSVAPANSTLRQAASAVRDTTAAVATASLAVGKAVGAVLVPSITLAGQALSGVGGVIAAVAAEPVRVLGQALDFAKTLFVELGRDILDSVRPAAAFVGTLFHEIGVSIKEAVGDAASWVAGKAGAIFAPLKPAVAFVGTLFGEIAHTVKEAIGDLAGWVAGKAGAAFGPIKAALGAVGGWAAATAGAVVKGFGTAGGAVVSAVGVMIGSAGKLTAAVLTSAGAVAKFVGGVAGLGERIAEGGADKLRQPLRVLDSAVSAMNMNVARFVQLASPAHFKLFTMAVEDLYASIGHALIPVMETMTQVVRGIGGAIFGTTEAGRKLIAAVAAGTVGLIAFGAAFAAVQAVLTGGLMPIIGAVVGAIGGMAVATGALQPLIQTLSATLSGMMDAVGVALESVASVVTGMLPTIAGYVKQAAGIVAYLAGAFERLGPAIGALIQIAFEVQAAIAPVQQLILGALVEAVVLLGQVVKAVSPIIIEVVQTVGRAIAQVVEWVRDLAAMVGITLPRIGEGPQGRTQDNTGAAMRQTSTTTPAALLQQAREKAFSLGWGPGKPEEQTAKNTSVTALTLEKLVKIIENFVANSGELMISAGKTALRWFWDILGDALLKLPAEAAKQLWAVMQKILPPTAIPGAAGRVASGKGSGADYIDALVPGAAVGRWAAGQLAK